MLNKRLIPRSSPQFVVCMESPSLRGVDCIPRSEEDYAVKIVLSGLGIYIYILYIECRHSFTFLPVQMTNRFFSSCILLCIKCVFDNLLIY